MVEFGIDGVELLPGSAYTVEMHSRSKDDHDMMEVAFGRKAHSWASPYRRSHFQHFLREPFRPARPVTSLIRHPPCHQRRCPLTLPSGHDFRIEIAILACGGVLGREIIEVQRVRR